MKTALLVLLLVLFSTSCGIFKRDGKAEDAPSGSEKPKHTESEKPKIQKNSAFSPRCHEGDGYAECDDGNPACGTQPGSGELRVYCIDTDDSILGTASCGRGRPSYCVSIDSNAYKKPKIQKSSAFAPRCLHRNAGTVECDDGSPACGTRPGTGELQVYCINKDDTILPEIASCSNKGWGLPQCVQLVQN